MARRAPRSPSERGTAAATSTATCVARLAGMSSGGMAVGDSMDAVEDRLEAVRPGTLVEARDAQAVLAERARAAAERPHRGEDARACVACLLHLGDHHVRERDRALATGEL